MAKKSPEWCDATSYSRGERGTVEPRTWAMYCGPLRIVVTRIHGCPEAWFASCHELSIDAAEAPHSDDLSASQTWALDLVRTRLTEMLDALPDEEPSR